MPTYVLPVNFPVSGLSPKDAVSSQALLDKLGVQVHMAFTTTSYADAAQVNALVTELGVKHVRDTFNYNFPTQHTKLKSLADAAGVKLTLAGRYSDDITLWLNQFLADGMAPYCAALECLNEPDNPGAAGWDANSRAWVQSFYAKVRAQSALNGLPIIAPGLMNTVANAATLGDLNAYTDRGNAHVYSGLPPSYSLASYRNAAKIVSGATTPIVITEQGYHNAMETTGSMNPVDEATAAVYMPKILFENDLLGTERVFIYELIDQTNQPANTDIQQHYGLVRYDYTKKPAFDAIKALCAQLKDDGAPYTPNPLPMAITPPGGNVDLRSRLVGKRDGTYRLYLWRDVSVWNTGTETAIAVPNIAVGVKSPNVNTTVNVGGSLTSLVVS